MKLEKIVTMHCEFTVYKIRYLMIAKNKRSWIHISRKRKRFC